GVTFIYITHDQGEALAMSDRVAVMSAGRMEQCGASADIYGTVSGLKASLEQTAKMLGNMNNGKGSAGQLLTNDSLYTNLSNSLESLNLLLQDMKENPKKYVHFSLF
nr:hypothetical protein [Bacteroidales bacterium]